MKFFAKYIFSAVFLLVISNTIMAQDIAVTGVVSSTTVSATTHNGVSFVKNGGTSAQFLKADGSVDASVYLTSAGSVTSLTGTANQITASASTGSVTLSLPSTISGLTTVSATNLTGQITTAAQPSITSLSTLTGLTVTGVVDINTNNNSNVSINGGTSTGTVTIGGGTAAMITNLGTGGTAAKTINIGTGSIDNIITIGNTTGTTAVTLNGGTTGSINLTPGTGGAILIGAAAGTGAITLGSSSATQIVNVGTGAGAATVNIATGVTSAKTVNIATGNIANTILIGNATTQSNVGINLAVSTAMLHLGAGYATASKGAPLKFTSGSNLTNAEAGAVEYDGTNLFGTSNTTDGRGIIPLEQSFKLTAAGSTISNVAANFFGTTSNIPLVASGIYEIEIEIYYLKTTAAAVVFTLVNTAVPTSISYQYEMSPLTGIVAPPGGAATLIGNVYNSATATQTVTTGSISNGVNNYARFKIILINNTGTSLKIQASTASGSLTPGIGSYWTSKRLPLTNLGTYAN